MRVHHLAFRTGDLAALEAFYGGVLGLRVLRRDGERSVWLEAAGTILMLEHREAHEPGPAEHGMDLACFAIEPDAHAAAMTRLDAAGVSIEGRTSCSFYFRDPDGRRIGLSSYPTPLEGGPATP